MNKLDNPHLNAINSKIEKVYDTINKAINKCEGFQDADLTINWDYNDNGLVWLNVFTLSTLQFKDEIKKAKEWDAEQKAKRLQAYVEAQDTEIAEKLRFQNDLQQCKCIYVKWDRVLDYYHYTSADYKIAKKLAKLDHVYYYKPAYGNCFGKIGAPDAVMVRGIKNGLNVGKLVVLNEYIDLEKTFNDED